MVASSILAMTWTGTVFIPGFVSNMEFYWEMPSVTRIFERLASFSRVILWDKRGTGLSDPVDRVPTLDERVDDLMAIMDTVGSERAAFFGISEGGPMSLLFAGSYPDRTHALVSFGSSPKFSAAPGWEWGWSSEDIARAVDDIDKNWGTRRSCGFRPQPGGQRSPPARLGSLSTDGS